MPVAGERRLGEHLAQRDLRLAEPAAGLELVAPPGVQPRERRVRVGGAEQRLGAGHDGEDRVRLAVEAVDQGVGFEAVPGELALAQTLGDGDAVPDERRYP